MYYHASQTPGLRVLEPRVSNHALPRVYFSDRRENVLVYLSNAVEKYCRETGFVHSGPWRKWAAYGFNDAGVLRLEEYYPNATEETYSGVSGYIYRVDAIAAAEDDLQIPHAFAAAEPTVVCGCEFVPDAYEALLAAEAAGEIEIFRYKKLAADAGFMEWHRGTVQAEYDSAADHPDYRHFLRGKFGDILN